MVTLKMLIWRVRPGVLDTLATDSPKRVFSMLLLPTLERPKKAISGKFVFILSTTTPTGKGVATRHERQQPHNARDRPAVKGKQVVEK